MSTPTERAWQLVYRVRSERPASGLHGRTLAGWRKDRFKVALRSAGIHWTEIPPGELRSMLVDVQGDLRTEPSR